MTVDEFLAQVGSDPRQLAEMVLAREEAIAIHIDEIHCLRQELAKRQ